VYKNYAVCLNKVIRKVVCCRNNSALATPKRSERVNRLISLYCKTLDCVTGEYASFNRRYTLSKTVIVRDGIYITVYRVRTLYVLRSSKIVPPYLS
jgi:hypothetical protein